MANPFTPEQISQILEEFFKVVGTRQYIGARYVPIFGRKGEDSIIWDNTGTYEPLTIVLYNGNSYTSRQFVPVGVDILNEKFWANTGNYNAQIEQYRRDVQRISDEINDEINDINDNISNIEQNISNIEQNISGISVRAALNVNPALTYEGIITTESVEKPTYQPAASVCVDEDTIIQIFENASDNTQDGIMKFIVVGEGQSNRVLKTSPIPNCGHANSAFINDNTLYVLKDGSNISVYTVNIGTMTVTYRYSLTMDVSYVGLIFYVPSTEKYYCGTTPTTVAGIKNISLYELDITTGKTTPFAANIMPDSIALTWPPLRNDCFFHDKYLFIALTNATGNVSFNALFVYNIENSLYSVINIPETCFAFSLGEIEGLSFDVSRRATYLTCMPNNNSLKVSSIFVGFCPFSDLVENGSYVAGVPNTVRPMSAIRLGTLDEGVTICQTGNTSTPATNLFLAAAMLHYQTHVLMNENCYILMLNDISETTNRLPDGDYHLLLNEHTLNVKSSSQGYVETGHGRHYINKGTINLDGDAFNIGRESVESLYEVNMSGATLQGGRAISILSNVRNVTITVQESGTANLIFRSGSTPAITTP